MNIAKKLVIGLSLVASTLAFADHHIERTCLKDVQSSLDYVVSSEIVINNETGITSAILASTTYLNLKDCFARIKKEMPTPIQPEVFNDYLEAKKCYEDKKNENVIYLVTEKINPQTGVVAKIDFLNEFSTQAACESNLN
jgi:hypothetical protein